MNSTGRTRIASTVIPPSQNTAAVHEHRGLFTHDLRRKAKRWQDGFLKFHTFNNRIMLYDDARNFVGDSYHHAVTGDGLQDGDEFEMDRGGVLVQVGERVGTQGTDLREMLARKTTRPSEEQAMETERVSDRLARTNNTLQPRTPNVSMSHLNRWSGWAGKAQLLQRSPFEKRRDMTAQSENHDEQGPQAKKRKTEDEHIPLWEILKTTRPSKSRTLPVQGSMTPQMLKTAGSKINVHPSTGKNASRGSISSKSTTTPDQARLKVKEIIDITSSATDEVPNPQQRNGVCDSSPVRRNTTAKPKAAFGSRSRRQLETVIGDVELGNNAMQEAQELDSTSHLRRAFVPAQPLHEAQTALGRIRQPLLPGDIIPERKAPNPDARKASRQHINPQTPPRVQPPRPKSPPVSTRNHMAPQDSRELSKTSDEAVLSSVLSTSADHEPLDGLHPRRDRPVVKPLQLAPSVRRNTLLCHEMMFQTPAETQVMHSRKIHKYSNTATNNEALAAMPSRVASAKDSVVQDPVLTSVDDVTSSPAFQTAQSVPKVERNRIVTALSTRARDTTPLPETSYLRQPEAMRVALEPSQTLATILKEDKASPPHLYPQEPPDYSRLDAQLLTVKTTFTTNKPYRPLRRAISDTTSVSPHKTAANASLDPPPISHKADITTSRAQAKSANTNTALDTNAITNPESNLPSKLSARPKPKPKASTRPLRRAETHTGIPNARPRPPPTTATTTSNPTQAQPQANHADTNPGSETQPKGPWTREAWDLLGWVPSAKVKAAEDSAMDGVDGGRDLDAADGGIGERVDCKSSETWVRALVARVKAARVGSI